MSSLPCHFCLTTAHTTADCPENGNECTRCKEIAKAQLLGPIEHKQCVIQRGCECGGRDHNKDNCEAFHASIRASFNLESRETSTSAPVPVVSGNGNPLESKKSSEGRQSVPFKTATLERSKPQPDKLPLPPSILSGSQLQKIRDLKDDDQPSPPEINKWGKDECKLCRKNGAPGRKHHPEYCIFNGEACDECGYFQGGGTVHRRDCSKEENVQIPPIQSTALGKRKKTHKPPPSPKVTSKSNGMQTTPGLSRTDGKGNTPKPTPPTRNVAPKGNGMQTVPGPSGPIGKSNTPTSSCPSRKVSQAQIDALSPFNVPVNDRRPRPDDIDAIRYGWTLAAGIFLQEEILAKGQKISNDDWLALTNVAIRIWELRRGDDD